MSYWKVVRSIVVLAALCCTMPARQPDGTPQAASSTASTPATDTVLKAADVKGLMPETVFFRGQLGTVQLRNAGGVRYKDGMYVLAGAVDSSGYSSGVQQKYQAYLLSEVPLEIGGSKLPPGAYGFGFTGDTFVVMDLGARDLLSLPDLRDPALRRPTPLQFIAVQDGMRLYMGRTYVVLRRAR